MDREALLERKAELLRQLSGIHRELNNVNMQLELQSKSELMLDIYLE